MDFYENCKTILKDQVVKKLEDREVETFMDRMVEIDKINKHPEERKEDENHSERISLVEELVASIDEQTERTFIGVKS